MARTPDTLTCSHCGRTGAPADAALGWSVSRPPRPVGSTAPVAEEVTSLCPDCARHALRDLEGRLDP